MRTIIYLRLKRLTEGWFFIAVIQHQEHLEEDAWFLTTSVWYNARRHNAKDAGRLPRPLQRPLTACRKTHATKVNVGVGKFGRGTSRWE